MRDVLDVTRLVEAMERRRAELAAGAWTQPVPAPLEAIRELAPDERSIFDVSGAAATPATVRELYPDATVDGDATREHDAAIVGTALARATRPAALLRRTRAALKPGGRALLLVPNRRSLFLVAGLVKNRPFTVPGAWPEQGPGPATLAEVEALLRFTGFSGSDVRARIGVALPAGVALPTRIAFDDVSIEVRTADDLRDVLTFAYVVAARRPANDASGLTLRHATAADARDLWSWRNDARTRAMSRDEAEVSWSEHSDWFAHALSDPLRTIYIGMVDGAPIGMCRFDADPDREADVSIVVAPAMRGRGLAPSLLAAAVAEYRRSHSLVLRATIRRDNHASIRSFERCGFTRVGESELFLEYTAPINANAPEHTEREPR